MGELGGSVIDLTNLPLFLRSFLSGEITGTLNACMFGIGIGA